MNKRTGVFQNKDEYNEVMYLNVWFEAKERALTNGLKKVLT